MYYPNWVRADSPGNWERSFTIDFTVRIGAPAGPSWDGPRPTVEGTTIYANGAPLIIDGDSKTSTTIYLDADRDGVLDPDVDPSLNALGITGAPEDGANLSSSAWSVYGGRHNDDLDGDTRITLLGGYVGNLYGGGHADIYGATADVTGSTTIQAAGGEVWGIYGGGVASAEATANIGGTTSISIGGSAKAGEVYGGGNAARSGGSAHVTGTAAVTVTGGQVTSFLYGGGWTSQGTATVGTTDVRISGGTVKNVYGGGLASNPGAISTVTGGASLRISGSATVSGNVYGGGYVYGGTAPAGTSSSVSVSGSVKIGGEGKGIVLNTKPDADTPVTNGVDTFALGVLTTGASVFTVLPDGAAAGDVIATNAISGDVPRLHLTGPGAADKIAYFENGAIKMRTKGAALLYSISGMVNHQTTNANIAGTVRLIQNGAVLQEQPFSLSEGYSFTGVKPGIYNIVAVMAGGSGEPAELTNTMLVTVKDRNLTNVNLHWWDGGVNSEVQIQPNTPPVAVGGLEEIAAGYDYPSPADFGVVRLTVQAVDDPADKGDIGNLAGGRTLAYWDLSLSFLYTDGVKIDLGDSNLVVLELVLPYDFTNKRDVTVYRKHGAQAAALTALPGAPDTPEDGTFWADTAGGYLHVYASKFSTYAVGYTPVSPSGGGGGGGGSNTATSTTTNADGSTTTTVTNRVTGAVTETTKAPGGTKTVVETKKDGSQTETVTTPDGGKTETATTAQGDKTYTEQRPDGTQIRADIPKTGDAAATVHLPGNAAAPVAVSFPVNDGTVVLRLLPDGTEEPVAYSLVEAGRVYVRLDGDAKLRVETRAGLFTDMDGHWAAESADFTGARELFQGTAPQIFTPERSMTRAMFATVLHRLDGTPDAGAVPFTDVEAGSWCAGGVAWAAENGIASGTGGGLFRGDRAITRQELAVMLWNYAQYDGLDVDPGENTNMLSFTDIDRAGEWAMPALQWACGAGILQGGADGTLNPIGTATRAQVAAILERFVTAAVK
ncbi:S-layer homology domain-containing protein [uncultured Oscillibacter sp.]|uniref:S-layer homology domain-containing protein n=1 Tax=uncultured Oscillibacter sp. TaxID=876091 RepID=UPI0025DF9DBC|nr:S-layer homology domain-containing protein [uncultured Oscillibacter sp.]